MKVDFVDRMGSDISVVNAARVSFDKKSFPISFKYVIMGEEIYSVPVLNTADVKLINFLAEHGHWSPFAHATLSIRVKAPIFVARQLAKHQVGLAWNEISRRYVDYEPELYWPEKWRKRADKLKQGSSDESFASFGVCDNSPLYLAQRAVEEYRTLVEEGLCPEQARMFLPQNTYTEWIWTGSLYAFSRVVKLRTDPTAQKETKEIAQGIADIAYKLFPYSWEALMEK